MINGKIDSSLAILRKAVETFSPTHIVSMVSGGKDSAASDLVLRELGAKVDLVIHGNTRCGIPETTDFVRLVYGAKGAYAEADAGTAYEDYVPVAKQLCRSGECMCGTMQTAAERMEAAALYPKWGAWLDALEAEAIRLHGFGWGQNLSAASDRRQAEMFQPMCKDCVARGTL